MKIKMPKSELEQDLLDAINKHSNFKVTEINTFQVWTRSDGTKFIEIFVGEKEKPIKKKNP